eukprot:Hpha_TRINITY_DN9479_c1_g1::TRINITY_DN9479_c1_g1_i1::g.139115::m.139115
MALRIDPADGNPYTAQEFFAEYKGYSQWEQAVPVGAPVGRGAPVGAPIGTPVARPPAAGVPPVQPVVGEPHEPGLTKSQKKRAQAKRSKERKKNGTSIPPPPPKNAGRAQGVQPLQHQQQHQPQPFQPVQHAMPPGGR